MIDRTWIGGALALSFAALATAASGQPAPSAPPAAPQSCMPRGAFAPSVRFKPVEVLADGRVTFRLCAPNATTVRVTSDDLPTLNMGMTKDETGLWTGTSRSAVPPDNYRYAFSVNGVTTPNPQDSTFAAARVGVVSTYDVPGAAGAFQTWRQDVPHGVVSEVEYWSASLGAKRRAHVYTPPGYMKNATRYPVLYLVHGAGDSDDSWTSVGHAHYILDNLIAAGKAKPMIVVMPNGHTPQRPAGSGGGDMLANSDFGNDFLKDLMPYIEANYRTINNADNRAMAGLSMGGAHTIQNGLTHPELFRYIGIFSMGLGAGGGGQAQVEAFEKQHAAALAQGARSFKLVYYAMGKQDFLYNTVAPTRGILDRAGIKHIYNETPGGHTWINWRQYLADLAPRLFR